MPATLDDWIRRDAIPFDLDAVESLDAAVDALLAALGGPSLELLGFGEALHGGQDILRLRNRLFQRLVAAHGYTAIALESSFPAARLVNDFVAASPASPASYDDVKEHGFSHGFGRAEANRELVEWMRDHNAAAPRRAASRAASHELPLRFYGFDIPGTGGYASPSHVLHFATDYLAAVDPAAAAAQRQRIDAHLAPDAEWENPAVYTDPAKSVALAPAAVALRVATEDLITELRTRRPELIAATGRERYDDALQHALIARQLLNSHAGLAARAGYAALLGLRDALMADLLAHLAARERARGGRLFVFAHNSHLQRGKVTFPVLGQWWPAGAHLHETLGDRYAVIGSAVGVSEPNGIAAPDAGSFEARLTAAPGPIRFIPTHRAAAGARAGAGESLAAELATLPTRAASTKNPTYKPLNPQSLSDFDALAVLDSTPYTRGGHPLPA